MWYNVQVEINTEGSDEEGIEVLAEFYADYTSVWRRAHVRQREDTGEGCGYVVDYYSRRAAEKQDGTATIVRERRSREATQGR